MLRIIDCFFISFLCFILSACSNTCLSEPTNKQKSFIETSLSRFMDVNDHQRLQQLVATASPEQWERWKTGKGSDVKFRSLKIYVNELGQICRDYYLEIQYQMKNHLYYYTSCRNYHGIWKPYLKKNY